MASARIGALRVDLGLNSAAFERGLDLSQRRMNAFASQMNQHGRRMQAIGSRMTLAITAPLVAFGTAATRMAIDSREAVAQVDAALNSMGNVAGRSADQLQRNATALQHMSTVNDNEILRKVTANLLTFGNVAEEQFDRAQRAIVDISARLGQDLQPITLMVGRALNDPILGLTALRRTGIQFTASQEEMIRSMVRAGNVMGAQRIMLSELERQFGGAAQAARDAAPGSDTIDAWRDFQEIAGEVILRVLPNLTDFLTLLLTAFNNLSPAMQNVIVSGLAVAAALGPIILIVGTLTRGIAAMIPLVAGLGASFTTAFLPWVALISGVVVAFTYLTSGTTAATAALDDNARATGAAARFQQDLNERLAQDRSDETAGSVRNLAQAHGEAADAAYRHAAGELAVQRAQAANALGLARIGYREETRTRYEQVPGSRRRRAVRDRVLVRLGNRRARGSTAGIGGTTEQERAIGDAQAQLEQLQGSLDDLRQAYRAAVTPPVSGGGGGASSGRGGGRRASGPSEAELAARMATLELEGRIAVARAAGDAEAEQSLQRQADLNRLIEQYRDAGLSQQLAEAAAARDMAAIEAATLQARQRATEQAEAQFNIELARERGDAVHLRQLEEAQWLQERIAYWQRERYGLTEAQIRAQEELGRLEAARADRAHELLADQERAFQLELARARGDDTRGMEADARYRSRVEDLMTNGRMSRADAEAQALREGSELARATLQGTFRDTFRDGLRAAMNGDLWDFLKNRWQEMMFDVFSRVTDRLADFFANLAFGGGGGKSGGGLFDFISGIAGPIFGGMSGTGGGMSGKAIPKFATGGSFKVGGFSGIDSNLLSLNGNPIARVSSGEIMDIRKGAANDGGGGVLRVELSPELQARWLDKAAGQSVEIVRSAAPSIVSAAEAQTVSSLRRRRL